MSDLSDETVRALAASVFDLEDDREQVQTDLKNVWSHIREAHGKRFADSLKLAIKRARMDQGKRIAADEVDAEAERLIGILNGPRAPRATRSASAVPIPPHDEDGVVLEDGGEQLESHAQQGVEGGDQASIIASEATMLPQTGGHQTLVDNSQAVSGTLDAATRDGLAGPAFAEDAQQANIKPAPDYTKPNPWCLDPEECGLTSWTHFCVRCTRLKAERQAASAVQ